MIGLNGHLNLSLLVHLVVEPSKTRSKLTILSPKPACCHRFRGHIPHMVLVSGTSNQPQSIKVEVHNLPEQEHKKV